MIPRVYTSRFIFSVICLVAAVACSKEPTSNVAGPKVVDIDASKAAELVAAKSVKVLDVRTQEEYNKGHIAGAVLVDFLSDDFAERVKQLPHDKPYVVHCAVGGRSRKAVDVLRASNASTIYHLNGGFKAWAAGNYPVEN